MQMNIHITCTPEFSEGKLDEVISLLSNVPGELCLEKGRLLTHAQFKRLNNKFENINQISSLSFEEYFDLIQGYRELIEISDDDFVIIISSIRNTRKWFSAFNGKNIFIHGVEWDLYADVDSKYGIAYQCVENIFQSLIELNIDNIDSEPNIHKTAIGCINDYCGYKPDILKKLQSANICPSCYERSVKKGVDDFIMAHIVAIMEEVRKEFVISRRFSRQTELKKIKVDEKGNITVGDRLIKMEILPKVMYIGFLKNISGIPSNQICANSNQFEIIYGLLRKNRDEYSIRRMCCGTIEYKSKTERIKSTFHIYRTKLKEALTKVLGATITNYYHVNLVEDENRQELYKVNLASENIDIDPKFK